MGKKKKVTESAKERMRKYRERIKQDPQKYDEMKQKERTRWKKRVNENKIQTAASKMTERERRMLQKQWREKTRKYRAKIKQRKELQQNLQTPPPSPSVQNINEETNKTKELEDKRKSSGEKRRKRNRKELKNKVTCLEKKLAEMTRKANKYRQRCYRIKKSVTTEDSPKTNIRNLLKGQKVSPLVRKKLLFGRVMEKQIAESFKCEKNLNSKREFIAKISGRIVKKYKYNYYLQSLTSHRMHKFQPVLKKIFLIKKKVIQQFLEKDENSRLAPGKKDTITKQKEKKQKRLLNDTLKNLHTKFNLEYPRLKLSYALFCRCRPFWIVTPNCQTRDTCLCVIHENFNLLVKKMYYSNIIDYFSSQDIVKAVVCEKKTEDCLERKCLICKDKKVDFKDFVKNDQICYYQWTTKKEEKVIKGKEKIISKTKKEELKCTKEHLTIVVFQNSLLKFLRHINNITHQYKVIDEVKRNLSYNEILIHMDFSENYTCKYSEEIQSVHFGSSKQQVSLHTVVVYIFSEIKHMHEQLSYCTIAQNLRHDPCAICAHLFPVIQDIKTRVRKIDVVHCLSDGPTTQYRNRKMFYLIGKYLPAILGSEKIIWHYTESGHGKGAPDGVGGALKRYADRLVATGTDIPNSSTLLQLLQKKSTKVMVMAMDEEKLKEVDMLLPNDTNAFKGTLQTHQVIWMKNETNFLYLRRLSCIECSNTTSCIHYGLGSLNLNYNKKYKLKYSDVYSDADSEQSSDEEVMKNDLCSPKIGPNNYVIIKLAGKKSFKFYVALIVSQESYNEFTVKFMRKCSNNTFVFPEKDDVSEVDSSYVVEVLKQPTMNKREQYVFSENLSHIL